jgi:hypothetical protein
MAKRDKRSAAAVQATAPEAGPAAAPLARESFERWQKPKQLTRRQMGILVGVVLLINLPLLHHWLRGPMPTTVTVPYSEDFSHPALVAERFFSTGSPGELRNGNLISPGVRNNALWLKASLPDDVRVSLTTRAVVPEADIRVEIFGNGEDTLSGYRLVLSPAGAGAKGILYRLGEQGLSWSELRARAAPEGPVAAGLYKANTPLRVDGLTLPIRTNETQHWVIERRGATLRWTINDQLVLSFTDPFPLTGSSHDRLGLSSNELDVAYNQLSVVAVPPGSTFPPLAQSSAPLRPATAAPAIAFSDSFDRTTLGPDWNATDPAAVRVDEGALIIEGGHNHPVWLRRPLPENAVIELDAWSDSPDGDLKVEAWGDGASAHEGDLHAAYRATGYVFVMGGWRNTKSVIARQEEHGHDGAERSDVHVVPGRHYHWRIERRGGRLQWDVDNAPFLTLEDPDPLVGAGQAYFAFSDWETRVHFDNLRVTPLNP